MTAFTQKFGPWALVTGASSGIGEEYALQLAEMGLNLILLARRLERLQALKDSLTQKFGIEVRIVQADLTSADYLGLLEPLVEELEIGLLVNNAGMGSGGPFLKSSVSRHQNVLALNCQAPMELAYVVGQKMKERGRGGVIFVGSILSFIPAPYSAHYAASKAYVLSLAEALYVEYRKKGVAVQALCPGFVKTELTEGMEVPFLAKEKVVRESLKKLGKRRVVIPGLAYKLIVRLLVPLVPRAWLAELLGRR